MYWQYMTLFDFILHNFKISHIFFWFIIHYQTHILQRLADHISGSHGIVYLYCSCFVQIFLVLLSNYPHFLHIFFHIWHSLLHCSKTCKCICVPCFQFDHNGTWHNFFLKNHRHVFTIVINNSWTSHKQSVKKFWISIEQEMNK